MRKPEEVRAAAERVADARLKAKLAQDFERAHELRGAELALEWCLGAIDWVLLDTGEAGP